MDQPMLHPPLPESYTDEWGRKTAEDLGFAPAVEAMLRSGRLEDARRLCEEGVRQHPWYATGHLLLGKTYLRQENWSDARAELERSLQLDGAYPALLNDLAGCYEHLGLVDLAAECRALGTDLDPRPLEDLEAEEEVTAAARAPEAEAGEASEGPPDEAVPGLVREEEEQQIEEAAAAIEGGAGEEGTTEDSLKELESLFEGASAGLEGTGEEREYEDLTEGGPDVADDREPEEQAEEQRDEELEIEEVEEAAEEGLEAEGPEVDEGSGDLAAAAAAAAAAYGLGGSGEGEEEHPTPAAAPAGGDEEEDKAELWKKIMEQADQVEGGGKDEAADLEALLGGDEERAEEQPEETEEADIRDAGFEGMGEGPSEEVSESVEPIEGLEISQPGGSLADAGPEHFEPDEEDAEGAAPEEEAVLEEDLVRGPGEISEKAAAEASEDLDLEHTAHDPDAEEEGEEEGLAVGGLEGLETTSFDEVEEEAEGDELDELADLDDLIGEEEAAEEPEEPEEEIAQPDVADAADEALKALEAELAGVSAEGSEEQAEPGAVEGEAVEEEAGVEGPEEEEEGLAVEGLELDAGPAGVGEPDETEEGLEEMAAEPTGVESALDELESASLEEDEIGLDASEELDSTAVRDPSDAEEVEEEKQPAPTAGGMAIDTMEDSVRAAIRAEILAAQGKYKEALRYFEALQLWDPERNSFKERVEQLRRISE